MWWKILHHFCGELNSLSNDKKKVEKQLRFDKVTVVSLVA